LALRDIFADSSISERRQAAASDSATRRMLMELAVDPDYLVRKTVAQNPLTPGDALVLLLGAERDAICKIAFSEDTPDFDPNRVLRLSSEEDLLYLANHANARSSTLDHLTTSDFLPVRYAALRNDNISAETLARVSAGRHPRLRQVVAELKGPTRDIFSRLAQDEDSDVRLALAGNPEVPPDVLATLAHDPGMRVRGRLALNPHIDGETLSLLSKDPVSYVRACVAAHPEARAQILDVMADDAESETRLRVAEHANTPDSVLARLASDVEINVRRAVALNPKTSVSILKRLAYDEEQAIQALVFARPECELFNEEAVRVLSRFAVDPQLLFETSPRRFCAAVFGSKHPTEIQFLFNDPAMESLTSLSSLQSVFVKRNSEGRVVSIDRHRYLGFLEQMNRLSPHSGAFAVDPQSLRCVFAAFSHEEILTIAATQRPGMSRDSFRMLADLLRHESDLRCGPKITMVRDWITAHEDYGPGLHNFLSAHCTRTSDYSVSAALFPQARFSNAVRLINEELSEEGVEIVLPQTAGDLLKLGQLMRHCCGSRYYVDACQDSRSFIFHLQPPGKPRRGTTFQFDHGGHLEQAKAFANADPDPMLVEKGKLLYQRLLSA
jgi:hypothetical protein